MATSVNILAEQKFELRRHGKLVQQVRHMVIGELTLMLTMVTEENKELGDCMKGEPRGL